MSYHDTAEQAKFCTGRVMVTNMRPPYCIPYTRIALDVGSLDAPDIIAAGSCRATRKEDECRFMPLGVDRLHVNGGRR